MRYGRWARAVVCALICLPAAARADYENKAVGNWIVTDRADRFSDGGTHIALTTAGLVTLAVRCLNKRLTLAILDDPRRMRAGDEFKVRLRVDRGDIFDEYGDARSDRLIEIPVTDNAEVRDMTTGKEIAVKIEGGGVTATHIFKLTGARRAFSDLVKVCSID